VNLRQFEAQLRAAIPKAQGAIRRELTQTAIAAEGNAKRNIARNRSGRLRRSITGYVEPVEGGLRMTLRAGAGDVPLVYARTQEEGGRIVARRGRYLAFPLPGGPAETARGVARYKSPRQVPGLSFRKTKSGGILGKTIGRGKRARWQTWYILVPSVQIPAQWYARRGFLSATDGLEGRLGERLAAVLA